MDQDNDHTYEFLFLLKKKQSPLHIREIGFDGFQGSYKQSSIYNQEKYTSITNKGCNQKSQAYMAMTLYTMFCDFEFVKNIFLQIIQPLPLETCLIVEKL